MNDDWQDAVEECQHYLKIGALNEDMIMDISFDYNVDEQKLREEFGYD